MKYRPHEYQKVAEEKIIELPAVGLFLDMGLGKTVITLSAINRLMYEMFAVQRVLRLREWRKIPGAGNHRSGIT